MKKGLSRAELTLELLRDVVYAEAGSPQQNEALDRAWKLLSEETQRKEVAKSDA